MTEPDNSRFGPESGMRSTKAVSIRLKEVVCELAMLPEMFSRAYACADRPLTAVVIAPKMPIRPSPLLDHCRRSGIGRCTSYAKGEIKFCYYFSMY